MNLPVALAEVDDWVADCQVERASYVWLPLLPREDGVGYELMYHESWRPMDFRNATRVPVYANATTSFS